MKKFRFLTLMAIFIALFTSCEKLEEWHQEFYGCYCEASSDMLTISTELYTEWEPTIVDFEGDCADATWWDLTGEWAELYPAEDCEYLGLTLTCENGLQMYFLNDFKK